MTMPLMFTSLNHIDNHELARLVDLWRSQALSGQSEASEIARMFIVEQRNRIQAGFVIRSANQETWKTAHGGNYGGNHADS